MSGSTVERVSAYLNVRGANEALTFYVSAFGAVEQYRLVDPTDGKVGHAEIKLGDDTIMLSDEFPDFGALAPEALGGSPVKMHLQVSDIDAFFARAIEAGATELRALKDEFHGHRSGLLADPFGHTWHVAERREEVSPQTMQQRWNDAVKE
jgi:uncharacterized glyoxalase superfamily protein PhnB